MGFTKRPKAGTLRARIPKPDPAKATPRSKTFKHPRGALSARLMGAESLSIGLSGTRPVRASRQVSALGRAFHCFFLHCLPDSWCLHHRLPLTENLPRVFNGNGALQDPLLRPSNPQLQRMPSPSPPPLPISFTQTARSEEMEESNSEQLTRSCPRLFSTTTAAQCHPPSKQTICFLLLGPFLSLHHHSSPGCQ